MNSNYPTREYIVHETSYPFGATVKEVVGELLRCKDCRHYAGDGKRCAWDICAFDNFYCYYGERKEE